MSTFFLEEDLIFVHFYCVLLLRLGVLHMKYSSALFLGCWQYMCLVGVVPYRGASQLVMFFVKLVLLCRGALADRNLGTELGILFLCFLLLCLWIFV